MTVKQNSIIYKNLRISPVESFFFLPGGGIVGQGGERIRAIIEELGCEVQVSREPLAGIAGHKRVAWLPQMVFGNVKM